MRVALKTEKPTCERLIQDDESTQDSKFEDFDL